MKKLGIFLISIFLGFIIILQIEAARDYRKINSSSNASELTSKVVLLTKEVDLEKTKIADLQKKHEEYQQALNNNQASSKLVAFDLDKLQKFLGQKEAKGPGVEIIIETKLSLEEMTDFINNLKNINVEALSLNDQRLTLFLAFGKDQGELTLNNKKISPSYNIEAIGNPDVLKEALERKGGIVDQLNKTESVKIEITKKSDLVLPAYQ